MNRTQQIKVRTQIVTCSFKPTAPETDACYRVHYVCLDMSKISNYLVFMLLAHKIELNFL